MGFAQFMSSGLGRGLRIVAGIILIAVGLAVVGGTSGIVLAVVGLVPLLAGVLDVCLFAPLFGAPLKGTDVRAHAKS
jgi:Inner membrane protein YgaP-like, transmembrane domain